MRLFLKILLGSIMALGVLAVIMHFRAKSQREEEKAYHTGLPKNLTLSSRSFPPNGDMPVNCTCKGQELSPALAWEGNQPDAESYVVLATDYDVPTPAFPVFNLSHWVVFNLPASARSLPEGASAEQMRMLGGKVGKNSTGDSKYIGPCPPLGRHGYVFRVYALDEPLSFTVIPDKQTILNAMKGHILGYGELTGYFGK
ncbi:YbhB/YbcL family Raf kinase inhibitor-like protein [Spirosoma soli]|uniref:YbhB/YbcL family Raf kinase inhibitor-like protein n=1 Tax=Spirosoma soli TaxID=1770529 RepID=A0ABW5LZ89_9BACT